MRVVTYNGVAIQLYLTEYHYEEGYSTGPYANTLWVDEARQRCILLDLHCDNLTAALEHAKMLIDANP